MAELLAVRRGSIRQIVFGVLRGIAGVSYGLPAGVLSGASAAAKARLSLEYKRVLDRLDPPSKSFRDGVDRALVLAMHRIHPLVRASLPAAQVADVVGAPDPGLGQDRVDGWGAIGCFTAGGRLSFVGVDVLLAVGKAGSESYGAGRFKAVGKGDLMKFKVRRGDVRRQSREVRCVAESGLNAFLLRSDAASRSGHPANAFLHWVASDVLPPIRKHGRFVGRGEDASDVSPVLGLSDGEHALCCWQNPACCAGARGIARRRPA